MAPIVSLAISLLPGLAKRVVDNVLPDVENKITRAVRDVIGTDDPDRAAERIADPKIAAELRLRLAEIEAQADAREAEARQKAREADLEAIRLQLEGFREEIKDAQGARSMLTGLSGQGSVFAWGPVIVSMIVVLGFFIVMTLIVTRGVPAGADEGGQLVFQIVNIVVGALTAAFATVVSFWLGSSQGSRAKDVNALQAQGLTASVQRENARATREIVSDQSRQTAELLRNVARPAPRAQPPGRPDKGTRQFRKCLDVVLRHEGGFVEHPDDPGGATHMGITHKTLAAWRKVDRCTREEVQALKPEEAAEIYRAQYWNALNCDQLPPGVDLVAFDFGVNAGVGQAARIFQRVLSVEDDGQVGPITLGAARQSEAEFVINRLSDERLAFYKRLPTWPTFGRGWERRTAETRQAALDMLRGG